jgi:hypothetical protein
MSEGFDQLAKLLAGGSRRGFLKGLGALLAGGFLAGFAGSARADRGDDDDDNEDRIEEACHKYCAKCPRRPRGVHGNCIRHCKRFLRKNPKGTLCGACTVKNPFTGCLSAATCCAATATAAAYCANLNTDVSNCGKCGAVCKGTTPGCCSGACVDLASDANNCGACGKKCTSTQKCTKGVCG